MPSRNACNRFHAMSFRFLKALFIPLCIVSNIAAFSPPIGSKLRPVARPSSTVLRAKDGPNWKQKQPAGSAWRKRLAWCLIWPKEGHNELVDAPVETQADGPAT